MADKKGGYRLQILIDADGKAAIEGIADVEKALGDLDESAANAGGKGADSFGLLAGKIKQVGAALLAAGAIKELGGYLAEAGMEAESLQKRLEFAAGGTDKAAAALDVVKAAAGNLGVGVNDLAEAYIRLTNLGIEPSQTALEAYANVAAASGKSVMDFAEAVADAVTGEFERLKEFGIKASVDGAKVALTFRGQTKSIANDAKSISDALTSIGTVEFAGAAKAQADTAKGAIDALTDSFSRLTGELAKSTGLVSAIKFHAQLFKSLADEAGKPAPQISQTQASLAAMTATLGVLQDQLSSARDIGDIERLAGAVEIYRDKIGELGLQIEVEAQRERELASQREADSNLAAEMGNRQAGVASYYSDQAAAATKAAQAIREATSAAQAEANLADARVANKVKLAELDAQAARDAIANGDASKAAADRQIAAEKAVLAARAEADAVAVRNAQTLAAVAQANLLAAQREAQALNDAKAPAKDLAAAMERLSQAKIASQSAALNADTAALAAMANAAERTRTQLAGVRSAQEALKEAQADQAGQKAAQGWEQASQAASRAASELQSGDIAKATKDIEAGFKTLGDAVRRGDTSAGIQVVQRQLEALAAQAEKTAQAVAKVDPAKKTADGKTAPQDQAATTDASKAAKDARSAVESALQKPIPIALDASASAKAAVEQVRSAFAGMQISIPVIAQIIPVGGGGGGSDDIAKAAAKVGVARP